MVCPDFFETDVTLSRNIFALEWRIVSYLFLLLNLNKNIFERFQIIINYLQISQSLFLRYIITTLLGSPCAMFANWIPSNYEFFHVEISQYVFVNLKENIINTIYKFNILCSKYFKMSWKQIIFEGKILHIFVSRNITYLLNSSSVWQNILWKRLFMM